MKLLRYGEFGKERPGVLDKDGQIRDLSDHIKDLSGSVLNANSINKLKEVNVENLPTVEGTPRLGTCVSGFGKFMCIGLNYADHAAETGADIPEHPILFMKANSAIVGPNDDVVMPRGSTNTDWEVELGVIIGDTAKYVTEDDALDYVAGYCVCNDVSERHFQAKLTGQWTKGKSCDTFGPVSYTHLTLPTNREV